MMRGTRQSLGQLLLAFLFLSTVYSSASWGAEPSQYGLARPDLVIEAAELASSGALTLDQVLQDLPYVNDGYGNSVRLFDGVHDSTLLLVNGQRLNVSRGWGRDLERIPLDLVEQVQISFAGAAARYGEGAAGGVVNVILRDAKQSRLTLSHSRSISRQQSTDVFGEPRRFEPHLSQLVWSRPTGCGGLQLVGSHYQGDDYDDSRRFNAFWNDTLSLSANCDLVNGHSLTGSVSQSELRSVSSLTQVDLGSTGPLVGDWLTYEARVSSQRFERQLEPSTNRLAGRLELKSSSDPSQSMPVEWRAWIEHRDDDELSFSSGLSPSTFGSRSLPVANDSARIQSAGFGLEWHPMARLTLAPSVAHSNHSLFGGHAAYSLEAFWQPTSILLLSTHWERSRLLPIYRFGSLESLPQDVDTIRLSASYAPWSRLNLMASVYERRAQPVERCFDPKAELGVCGEPTGGILINNGTIPPTIPDTEPLPKRAVRGAQLSASLSMPLGRLSKLKTNLRSFYLDRDEPSGPWSEVDAVAWAWQHQLTISVDRGPWQLRWAGYRLSDRFTGCQLREANRGVIESLLAADVPGAAGLFYAPSCRSDGGFHQDVYVGYVATQLPFSVAMGVRSQRPTRRDSRFQSAYAELSGQELKYAKLELRF